MKEIFEIIKTTFGNLWKCRPRGESLEVITPFATTTDMFISVFITRRQNNWIISDGGWLDRGVYHANLSGDLFSQRIFDSLVDDMQIKNTRSERGIIYYYRLTDREELISNQVLELASFLSNAVNLAAAMNLAAVEVPGKNERHSFKRNFRQFLSSRLENEQIRFDTSYAVQDAYFNAIVNNPTKGISLINLVAGSNFGNLKKSFASSNLNFDLLDQSALADKVSNRIVVIDDSIISIGSDNLQSLIQVSKTKGRIPLSWESSKEELLHWIA